MKYVVANWKQHKTEQDAAHWLHELKAAIVALPQDVHVVVAAPYPLLPVMRETIDMIELPIGLAAQDVSAYPDGAYTGEVGGAQLQYLIDSVIIGHSERRMYFGDDNQTVAEKVARACEFGLTCFVCVADQITQTGSVPKEPLTVESDWFTQHVESAFEKISADNKKNIVLVYEPISAISTFGGQPLTKDECAAALQNVQQLAGIDVPVMYGGSVSADNVLEYWGLQEVAGIMPGNASLAPEDFIALLTQITHA